MTHLQTITPSTAVPMGPHAHIRAARTAMPASAFTGPVRAFVANVCSAEAAHAKADFWSIVHRINADGLFDRYRTPDCHAAFALEHEVHAGAALNWLSHLQTHDGKRRGPWSDWRIMSREEKAAWIKRRRYLVHGLLRQVGKYQAARAALAS